MYIKFPTVTKLQYSGDPAPDPSLRATQSFRHNFAKTSQLKLDLIRAAESFKIVQLPDRGEIMNICTMTVQSKDRGGSPTSAEKDKSTKKKVFSVSKLGPLAPKPHTEGGSANPLRFRSTSIKDFRKLTLAPQTTFDYFEVYPQVARLIALSWGVGVVNEGAHKLRRARVEPSNNGLLVRQTLKKRIWWIHCEEKAKEFGQQVDRANWLRTKRSTPKSIAHARRAKPGLSAGTKPSRCPCLQTRSFT